MSNASISPVTSAVDLANRIDELRSLSSENWRVEKEPHSYEDGTTHFNHVRFTAKHFGEDMTVEVASHVSPNLGELLCLLNNNLETILGALRAGVAQTGSNTEVERLRNILKELDSYLDFSDEYLDRCFMFEDVSGLQAAFSRAHAALDLATPCAPVEFTQCEACWQPATCKKYGCSHSSTNETIPDGDPEIANGEWPNVDCDGEPVSSKLRGDK